MVNKFTVVKKRPRSNGSNSWHALGECAWCIIIAFSSPKSRERTENTRYYITVEKTFAAVVWGLVLRIFLNPVSTMTEMEIHAFCI